MFPQSFLILSDLIPVSSIYGLFPLFFYRSSDRVLPISHHEPQTRWPGPTIRNMNELVSSRVLPLGSGPPPPTGSTLQPTGSTLPPMIIPCRWCQTTNPGDCRDGFCASMWNKENLMRPIHIWLHSSTFKLHTYFKVFRGFLLGFTLICFAVNTFIRY